MQGDERDVIFISVGYGRTANGVMSMRFGPLGSEGGERRLNVLISRAKLRCEVFSSITDEEFEAAGAHIQPDASHVWESADLVVKVKEPLPSEYGFLREDLLLFTYLHLAASRDCAQALLDSRTTSIAYETVELPDRTLPLLAPMSEVAGRLAPQVGAQALLKANGGRVG